MPSILKTSSASKSSTNRSLSTFEIATRVIEIAAVSLLSIIGLFVSCTANTIATSQNDLVAAQNSLVEYQASINEGQLNVTTASYIPEFLYLGPAEKKITADNADIQPEGYYDFGYKPKFAKISGYASNLTCQAYRHYEFFLSTSSNNSPGIKKGSPARKLAAIDVYGNYSEGARTYENGLLTMTIGESYSEIDITKIFAELESRGYHVSNLQSACIETISYTDIVGAQQERVYWIDLKKKARAYENWQYASDGIIPIEIKLDWSVPNLGLQESWTVDIAKECIERFYFS